MQVGVPGAVSLRGKCVRLRWTLALVGLPLGIAVCHYPGFMMSGLVARPLWSTALLPTVTLLSGVATALATIILYRAAFSTLTKKPTNGEYLEESYLLVPTKLLLLIAEAVVLAQIIVYARSACYDLQLVIDKVIGEDGMLTNVFWWWGAGRYGIHSARPHRAGIGDAETDLFTELSLPEVGGGRDAGIRVRGIVDVDLGAAVWRPAHRSYKDLRPISIRVIRHRRPH